MIEIEQKSFRIIADSGLRLRELISLWLKS
jgi:hypothetical protein